MRDGRLSKKEQHIWNTHIENKWKAILLVFVVLNTADLLLTMYCLRLGAVELNPLAQPHSSFYIVIKIILGPSYAGLWYITAIVAQKCKSKDEGIATVISEILKLVLLVTVAVYVAVVINNVIVFFKVLG